ncbi:MAG TPA: MerR family transcriptional regulator [Anaerolineales bacterium]|nr:MerR family transcriptional regulator [Anaerolineales bacterium]
MFTVKQLSKLAGVTPRTLHHYDQIGLLKPSRVGDNGYRYYGEESVLRLQQILFYRELGIPLEDIKKIMGRRDFDVLGALHSHKDALQKQVARLNRLISTVDNTILYLKGNKEMSNKQLFEAFSDEQQAEYEKEIMQKYDPATVKASVKKWKEYTLAEKQRIGEEGNAVYKDILAAMPKGAASHEAQAGIERWRKHIEYFWIPDDEQLLGLADLYNEDSRFKANFNKIDPRLAEFMREAVKIYVSNRKK